MEIQKIATFTGHQASVYHLAPGDLPGTFFSAGGDAMVVRWHLQDTDKGQAVAKTETQLFSLCHLPARQLLVTGDMNGGMHWIDLRQHKDIQNIAHHQKGVFAIKSMGEQLWTAGGEGRLTRWDLQKLRPAESLQLSSSPLRALAFAHQNPWLAVGASDNHIYLLDPRSGTLVQQLKNAHANSVFALAFSPGDRYLFSGSRDARLKVWDARAGFSLVQSIPAHMYTINALAHHPEKPLLVSASRDRSLKIWDTRKFKLLKVVDTAKFGGHFASVNHLMWVGEENLLASASDDRNIILWKIVI